MESMWRYAVAGNIKETHIDDNGVLRYGTATFRGNAKVYLCGRLWDERLPDNSKSEIAVLGINRGGRYCVEVVPIALIENLRIKKVFTPKVLEIMSHYEFSDGWWGNTAVDKQDATEFINLLKEKYISE